MTCARLAVVLALTLVTAVCVAILTEPRTPGGQRIVARFDAVNGLIAGAPVSLGGVPAGRVESVGLGPGDEPQVVMRLDRGAVLHAGATADLRLQSQVGQLNRYIEVTTGSGAPLRDGAVLQGSQTDQPVEIDDALSTLTPATRQNVRRLATSLDATLRGHGDDLAAAVAHGGAQLDQVSRLASVLADDGPALSILVSSGRKITGALASDPEGLQGTADQLASTLRVTARNQAAVGASVASLEPSLRSARTALDGARAAVPDVRGLLDEAAPAARQARTSAPVLAAALHVAPEALAAAQQLAVQAPAQLTALRPLVKQAKPVVAQLPSALKQFLPVLDQMRARAPDALGWLPMLGDALANYDENGHGARLMLITAPAPDDPVAADEQKPGLLEAPFDRVPGVLAGEPWRDFRSSMLSDQPQAGTP